MRTQFTQDGIEAGILLLRGYFSLPRISSLWYLYNKTALLYASFYDG